MADYENDQKFVLKVGLDIFKEALTVHLGGNMDAVLSCESFEMLKSFLPTEECPFTHYKHIKLIDLVNFTDFVDISKVLTIYQ